MHRLSYRKTRSRLLPGITSAAVASAWLLAVPPANAQDQKQNETTQVPAPEHQSQSPTIPDAELNAAAAAIKHVTMIKDNYQQRLTAAPASERDRIAGEATNALRKAITDEGLSVDEYNSIIEAALNDPTVREQLVQRIHPTGNEGDEP